MTNKYTLFTSVEVAAITMSLWAILSLKNKTILKLLNITRDNFPLRTSLI